MIINITGGPDLTLAEVSEASEIIYSAAHEEANIIFGAVVDPAMEGKVKITVIATGFDRVRADDIAGRTGDAHDAGRFEPPTPCPTRLADRPRRRTAQPFHHVEPAPGARPGDAWPPADVSGQLRPEPTTSRRRSTCRRS